MPGMTDPTPAMKSFQFEFAAGNLEVVPCQLDPQLFMYVDRPTGKPRFTYVRIDGKKITAFVMATEVDPVRGVRCWQLGYAVPEELRGNGNATSAVKSVIAELRYGLGKQLTRFFIEAMVDVENVASQRVANKTISANPEQIMDKLAKQPALQYFKEVVAVV